jgi:hypothetical protein
VTREDYGPALYGSSKAPTSGPEPCGRLSSVEVVFGRPVGQRHVERRAGDVRAQAAARVVDEARIGEDVAVVDDAPTAALNGSEPVGDDVWSITTAPVGRMEFISTASTRIF